MTAISTWSTTAASNNSASPDGAPEGMAPSGVNNTIRENMAQVRAWYDTMEWRDLGHTITYVAATQFKTSGVDTTSFYKVRRRVHANGSTTGDIYGTVTASAFSTDTTVTVQWDTTSQLASEALTIEVGLDGSNNPGPIELQGWTVVTAPTATSAVASYEIDILAGHDYRFEWFDVLPDANDVLTFRLFEGSYITTSTYERNRVSVAGTSVAGNADDPQAGIFTGLTQLASPSDAWDAMNGFIEIYQAAHASIRTSWFLQSHGNDDAPALNYHVISGKRQTVAVATKFKAFWLSANNFTSTGYYAVYRRFNGN